MNLMRYRDFGVISSKIILALLRRTTLRPKRLYLPGMQQFVFDPREVVSTFNEIFVCEIYRPIKPLPNNCRVLDIGAHYGLFAIYAMLRFMADKIECFEPNPNTFQFLRANIAAAHNNSRVSLNPVAVCRQPGTTKLFIPADGAMSVASRILHSHQESEPGVNGSVLDVRAISIEDALGEKTCDFLKLDAEGAEYDILKSDLIRPKLVHEIVVEMHDIGQHKEELFEIFDLLFTRGYRSYDMSGKQIMDVSGLVIGNGSSQSCVLHFA